MIGHAKTTLALSALLASTSALSATPDWRVSEVSGSVTVERAGKVLSAKQDTILLPGDTIRTGRKGRAVLVRGKEFVMVSPDAQLKVAVPEKSGPVVQFFQYVGNALFKIEKKSTPHFGVKTPYLAAVVKGTTFNVSVGADRSSVQVTEGAVEVATGDDLEAALITPGLIGFVDADDAGELMVIAGGRAGEDLSGAVVRGTPEFVQMPPQAGGVDRDMMGASGATPAALRSNRALNDDAVLAGAGTLLALNFMDDDVSGGNDDAVASAATGRAGVVGRVEPEAFFGDSKLDEELDDGAEEEVSSDDSSEELVEEQQDEPSSQEPIDAESSIDDDVDGDRGEADDDENGAADPEQVDNDGNNGHGDDPDGDDDSNPGRGNGNGGNDEQDGSGVEDDIDAGGSDFVAQVDTGEGAVGGDGIDEGGVAVVRGTGGIGSSSGDGTDDDADVDLDLDDDGNKGHGNDPDGYDDGNPGKGKGRASDKGGDDDEGVDLGFGTDDDDDGNNGHGNDPDRYDEGNPGKGKGKGRGKSNASNDEFDGSGVEDDIDAGGSGDVAQIAFDEGDGAEDEGGNGGFCLGDFCFDRRNGDDEEGRDENRDGDGRACGRVLCLEGPGIDDGSDDDDGDEDDFDDDDDDDRRGGGNGRGKGKG